MEKLLWMLAIALLLTTSCRKEVACTKDAKICPDGSGVGRMPPNCEFAECPEVSGHFCSEADKAKEVCPQEESQVCGWFNKKIQCFAYPCAQTYQNSCFACANENVAHWTEGACQKTAS